MFCSRCGATNPDGVDVRYCRSCGAELVAQGLAPSAAYSAPPEQAGPYPTVMPEPVGYPQAVVFPYGGFWVRVVAYFIDAILIAVGSGIVGFALGIAAAGAAFDVDAASDVATVVGMVLGLLYSVVFPPTLGATPGKLALGYHIVDGDGRHIGFGRAIARVVGQFVSGLVFLLGYIWIGIDSRKQGWHDKIAGTYVVRKEFVRQ